MKKTLVSLTAAFTLAVSGVLGTPAAQAQTVYNTTPYSQTNASGYVSQRDISTVANTLGVMTAYPAAGRGFSSGILHRTGQHIGLEFALQGGGMASVVRAYNLDNPAVMRQYRAAMADAAAADASLSGRFYGAQRPLPPSYRPSVPEVIAGVGLLYLLHEAITNDRDHRRYDRYDHRRDRHDRYDRHQRHDRHDRHNPRHR